MPTDTTFERHINEGYPVPVDGIPLIRLTPGFVPFAHQEQLPIISLDTPEPIALSVRSVSEDISVSS